MVSAKSLILAACAAVGVSALNTNQEAFTDGFYFSFWKENGVQNVDYENLANGAYTLRWGTGGNLVAGRGRKPSNRQSLSYKGTFTPGGNSYLSVYGWYHSPSIEYYITDNWGTFDPRSQGKILGQVKADGGTYDIVHVVKSSTFQQYWSVRQGKRPVSPNTWNTVTVATHFDAWAQHGMPAGSNPGYQIVATEGYKSSGSSNITVRLS